MSLKHILKSIRWFLILPIRLRYLSLHGHRRIATGMHWSTVLLGKGIVDSGRNICLGPRTRVSTHSQQRLIIGDGTWIGSDCEINANGLMSIGAYVSLQDRSQLHGDISIGAGTICAPNVYVSSFRHHFDSPAAWPIRWQDAHHANHTPPINVSRPITIGEDCWLGINAVITPGVSIGRGCIIGANSVVTKDIPPYSIVGGTPARILNKRLDFVPPTFLDSTNQNHIPYFYEGFSQWDSTNSPKKILADEGWCAEGAFSLAMNPANSTSITIRVNSQVTGTLVHGQHTTSVPIGRSELSIPTHLSHDGLLRFHWTPSSSGAGTGLLILSVVQGPNAIA